jgi:hypothetical protein
MPFAPDRTDFSEPRDLNKRPTAVQFARAIKNRTINWLALPRAAKLAFLSDFRELRAADPGLDVSIHAAAKWLARAQDNCRAASGGVAFGYNLIDGWGAAYPETTGYIVPTMLDYASWSGDDTARARAKRMLDWLVSIQHPDGWFQGGRIGSTPVVPVTFNTGQVLIGLAAGVRAFGDAYLAPMHRAASWLRDTQDNDGCWRRHQSPFVVPGDKTYDTHVAWGLLEASRHAPDSGYAEAAAANITWAISRQRGNGWMEDCCVENPDEPLTHTLGYALRGMMEGHRYTGCADFLAAARALADGLLTVLGDDGFLAGKLRSDWSPAVTWSCLTGTVQIAHSWLMLFQITGETAYRDAGFRANQFVRRTISLGGSPEIRGAVKGSFPVNGNYGPYEFLNWAAKFFIDSNLMEQKIRDRQGIQA